ncbi:HypC/HybG/HupF family hydrogenase formation chaperone [Rhodoplanes elegans]|nr:HypC/HybG/HupF family hydrogenase formation chaperone [Rhodoplanes elegans]
MCIALPRRIVAVVDRDRFMVALAPEASAGPGDADTISVSLLADGPAAADALVGAWVLVHAGFALAIVDAEDARSRLQVFAAMRGDSTEIDFGDFAAVTGRGSGPRPT